VSHAFFRSRIARRIDGPSANRQQGVSLIIAMIMLVVIGLVSVGIMRAATSSDQVSLNNRLQTQANQYAQAALQFCENQIAAKVSVVNIQPIPPAGTNPAWTVKDNWLKADNKANAVYRLGKDDLPISNAPTIYPQCLVGFNGNDPLQRLLTVTARGFSNDYKADGNGVTKSGSVVWLQSNVLAY